MIRLDFNKLPNYTAEIAKLARLLGKTDELNAYLDFYDSKIQKIKDTVAKIPDSQKVRAYLEDDYGSNLNYYTSGTGQSHNDILKLAGGINVFGNVSGFVQINPEDVIARNPAMILKYKYPSGAINRSVENATDLIAIRDEIARRPELQTTAAVRNNSVYVYDWYACRGGALYYLCIEEMAKWMYPGRFQDLQPRADYEEYLKRFQHLDIDLDKYGVFFYPEVA